MQLLTYRTNAGETVGLHVQGTIYDIQACMKAAGKDWGQPPPGALPDLKGVITAWDVWESPLRRLEEKLDGLSDLLPESAARPVDEISFLPPLPRPGKNPIMLGRNYQAHAEEGARVYGTEIGSAIIENPIYFTKTVTSLVGHKEGVIHHPATKELDYEAELVVIIGPGGRSIPPERVIDHIFGYTICNDVSARDLQHRHNQWYMGKSLDTSCPIGPWIVTKDEVSDPHNLDISCRINGETRQNANTSQFIFDIPSCISVYSGGITLEPGDIIATGTPEGCGFAMDPPHFLKVGDQMECEVEKIGILENPVIAPPG